MDEAKRVLIRDKVEVVGAAIIAAAGGKDGGRGYEASSGCMCL